MAKGMGIQQQQQHNIIIPLVKSYSEPDMKNLWWQTLLINDRVEAAEHNKLLILWRLYNYEDSGQLAF